MKNPGPGWPQFRCVRVSLAVVLAAVLGGCALIGAQDQLDRMEASCVLGGTVAGERGEPGPYVVAALHNPDRASGVPPVPVDHVLTGPGGEWFFALQPGRYTLIAFRDVDADLVPAYGEPVYEFRGGAELECPAGSRLGGLDIVIPYDSPNAATRPQLELSRLHPVERGSGPALGLGHFTRFGEVVDLDDPRFDTAVARRGMWRPLDFVGAGHAGIYFLEPYDPARTPVLFIHGIAGSPRDFTDLVAELDRDRFQPWFYYYSSGIDLQGNAAYLAQIMEEMEYTHGVEGLHVVAHSMGGLVARAYLNERERRRSPAQVVQFVTLATPWAGHAAAEWGVNMSPVVLPVWRDIVPASGFLERLFASGSRVEGPGPPAFHLLFSFRGDGSRSRVATDGVVTLASMLRAEAQEQARSVTGIHDTHVGILGNPRTVSVVNAILAGDNDAPVAQGQR